MWKPTVLVAAALAVAGSSIVYAQEHFAAPDRDGPRFENRHRLSPEDRAAFVDARIAALKAGLELTPDQAKNLAGTSRVPCETWRSCAPSVSRSMKRRNRIRAGRDARPSTSWRSAPTTWPKQARRSCRSPTLASRSMTVSATRKGRASRNLRACYGYIIIACTLGTRMMALLIRVRGRYKNECKDIALPGYPTARGRWKNTQGCHHGYSRAGDPTANGAGP